MPIANLDALTKLQLHALADALASGDGAAIATCVEFVTAESSGLWHGRARAMMCRRFKHRALGAADRERLVMAITQRLATGTFAEQFRDQLRLAMQLDPDHTFEVARACQGSPLPHVRRYAEWVLRRAASGTRLLTVSLSLAVLLSGCGASEQTGVDTGTVVADTVAADADGDADAGDAAPALDGTADDCASRTVEACEADAGCIVIEGYPVADEPDLDGTICVDLLGEHDPIGCVPADSGGPEMLGCMRHTATGEIRVTLNRYDALIDQGWEYCADGGVPPCRR